MGRIEHIPGTDVSLTIEGFFPSIAGFSNKLQLLENQTYEYILSKPSYQIVAYGIVAPSKIYRKDGLGSGLIRTGTYVGMLDLRLYRDNEYTGHMLTVEVQSSIVNYQKDYRHMLNGITDFIADLQLQLSSPVHLNLKSNIEKQQASPIQKLFFLLGLIQDEKFQQALHMIINRPNSRWTEVLVSQDTRRARHFSGSELRQLVSAKNRSPVSEHHPLYKTCPTIARKIESFGLTESADTIENRFVKYVLTFFAAELENFERNIPEKDALKSIIEDAISTKRNLYSFLGRDFFKNVSQLTKMPGNSPLLQRKEGYREILKKWIQYRLGSNISWEGCEDIYRGGQRDLAKLYEYWCFFQLLNILRDEFGVGKVKLDELIGQAEDGFGIKLKAGTELSLSGIYQDADSSRNLNIRFSYNRTFARKEEITRAGTWSLTMRPDYTISFWPTGLEEHDNDRGEQTAEELKLITHVHFDAKYKAESVKHFLEEMKSDTSNQASSEDTTFKRIDLLKMHSYRDAIRRTGGAYVLYPGSESKKLCGFHELLPGLGAFSLRPENLNSGTRDITLFLRDLVKLLCDRISQWEQTGYYDYDIHVRSKYKHGDSVPYSIKVDKPVVEAGKRISLQHSYDQLQNIFILKVSKDSKSRAAWDFKEQYYNLPANYPDLEIQHIAEVKYLLQPCPEVEGKVLLWEIKKLERIIGREQLEKDFNYPEAHRGHGKDGYILYCIERCNNIHGITPAELDSMMTATGQKFITVGELLSTSKGENNGN